MQSFKYLCVTFANHPDETRLSLLKLIGDNSNARSLATAMRRRRFAFFLSLLKKVERPIRILDVGGTREFWELMGHEQLGQVHVTLLNTAVQPVSGSLFTSVAGDARDLSRWESGHFDVVFSNSVIEHLGPNFYDQQRMANEIRRIGKRYFVQTPSRYFPLEPHFLTPFFQFLPLGVRAWMVSRFSVGWYPRIPDRVQARVEVESVALLSLRQVRVLFPQAAIYREKIFGITKSFVAYWGF